MSLYDDLTPEAQIILACECIARGAAIPSAISDTLGPDLMAVMQLTGGYNEDPCARGKDSTHLA